MLHAALALLVIQSAQTTQPSDPIVKPPENLSYGGFYTKCAYFQGMPIISSSKVADDAFHRIIYTFGKILANCPPGTMKSMVDSRVHYSIIASVEGQTDLPEYADLKNDPKTDWNKRARGLGGRTCSGGEENILEYPTDRYKGECIYIHEFSHTLDRFGFGRVDPKFRADLKDAYDTAMTKNLWDKTYSKTNQAEYFAEGVQMYFDCARVATPPNGVHNEVGNREALKRYDTKLYALVDREFGGNPWKYEWSYNKTALPLPAFLKDK